MTSETKVWAKEEILKLIETNDTMVKRSVVQIFNLQTESEKANESTTFSNGYGFNGVDAEFGSSIAKKILSGWYLTDKQLNATRRMLKKYAGQLVKIANKEIVLEEKGE
jgi:hypothetical protein